MIGIILAGGKGTRLSPITDVVSKQLLPIFDKPMIYYPLSLLMAAGIRRFLLISTPSDLQLFKKLLGNGSQWGIHIDYRSQAEPKGLPEAFTIADGLIEDDGCTLVLGDNIFFGSRIAYRISEGFITEGAHVYGYLVDDVSSFGCLRLGPEGRVVGLEEKPEKGGRGLAIPGLYHFDRSVVERSRQLKPSARGELEITDLVRTYLEEGSLRHSIFDRGTAWLDTGTIEDMGMASEFIRVIQTRQGMLIGSPEEVAFRQSWIGKEELLGLATRHGSSAYGRALKSLALANQQ